jgi:CobQ-like glutamine amidotransferase family enzyme
MMEPSLRIGHLYPNEMNLYGDRGNLLAFSWRARLRGIEIELDRLLPGDPIARGRYDFFFFGGGQDAEQERIHDDFLSLKGESLARELDDGAACLAVCGGYQLLGKQYLAYGGKRISGLGWLDLQTEAGSSRAIGNILIESELDGRKVELVGFENHGGQTFLGRGVKPLGRVVAGFGNNGQDGTEGAVVKSVVGTYLHGPLLPKNPALTDWLLARSLARRYPEYQLAPAASQFEEAAFAEARREILAQKGLRPGQFARA